MLIALAISAMLLTATMVAIDASFHAYAVAAQSASSQTATRMVTHRVLTLVRTSTAHGPLAIEDALPGFNVSIAGNIIESDYLELVDSHGRYIRLEYHADTQQLWVTYNNNDNDGEGDVSEPLLGGVTQATFHAHRRIATDSDSNSYYVLDRATMDITVQPDLDNTLQVELANNLPPIRVVASTMPRKLTN